MGGWWEDRRPLWHAARAACTSAASLCHLALQVRAQRLKWRTEDARLGRHAGVLRRFWQTHSGVTLGDAVVAALVLAGTASIAQAWRTHLAEAQPEAPTQQQAQQQQQP